MSDRAAGPGLEHGHHLRADGGGVHVPGGGDRLVQPVRAGLAAVEHAGRVVLPGDAGGGVERGAGRRSSTPTRGCSSRRQAFTGRLEAAGVAVSMDGRGRALDNVFVERLWRSVKYEDIYIKGYETVPELESGLTAYFRFYNEERPHQSLDYRTPGEVYRAGVRRGTERGRTITNTGPRVSSFWGPLYHEQEGRLNESCDEHWIYYLMNLLCGGKIVK